jgi:hypothetical protein
LQLGARAGARPPAAPRPAGAWTWALAAASGSALALFGLTYGRLRHGATLAL